MYRLRRHPYVWLSIAIWRRRLVFWGGAVAIGIVATLFATSADMAQHLFQAAVSRLPLLPLALTPAGLALSAWLALSLFPGSQGSGIPQTIAARRMPQSDRRRLMSL